MGRDEKIPVIFLLKCLLAAYIVTAFLLLLLAFLVYKAGISEKIVSGTIIAIYVVVNFLAGFLAGKRMGSKKFLWGLLVGGVYFLVLAALSLIVNHSTAQLGNSFVTTLTLCCGGGMLGGMFS